MSAAARLESGRLLDEAAALAGTGEFGEEPDWREGLDRLLEALRGEARLSPLGVEVAARDVVRHLANRAAILAWRRSHPEVGREEIRAPIVIAGQPRTGTTILYDLLALDPGFRAPLTWEVDRPVPPPETASFDSDPRIAEVEAELRAVDRIVPGFTDFHPMGARLAQECVRITGSSFRSMIFPTQYRVPGYAEWLLRKAELGPAYRWHRVFLQHLQSRHRGDRWLLKSPGHLWHLEELAHAYPDVVLIRTHRDPLRVIASVAALVAHLRRMASEQTRVADAAIEFSEWILLGLDRAVEADERGLVPPDRVIDVHFTRFTADPLGTVAEIYRRLGRELEPGTLARMRGFLDAHPGDGGGAGRRYRFSDTGLDPDDLRERTARYERRFAVEQEPLA